MPEQQSETAQQAESRVPTGLVCLQLAGSARRTELDPRRLVHEFALELGEPSPSQLARMAAANGLKARVTRLDFDAALQLGAAVPVPLRKIDGGYVLLCGVLDEPEPRVAVFDPAPDTDDDVEQRGPHRLWTREYFATHTDGNALLLKKRYRLDDEQQPFGLRWFIPEFLKLKGVFGQIALGVGLLTLLALLTPLFFQMVIDKVLPHQSTNTLNVLGAGMLLAILFNGALEFLRNYLLLHATNKIDINTATRTFGHLMRLPVEFFARVPSGLLLKHMQQTEKIRGFLSGNLFFTFLDLCSLLIFIPFLLLYSVRLTLVVLGFSALMALVVAALIKPFQHRLNILYQAEGKRQSRLVESIHGIQTVKALALEPVERSDWDDASAFAIRAHFQVGKISFTAQTLSRMLEMAMNVAVIWVGAHLVFEGAISIGALIAFQMLSGRVSGPLVKLVSLIHEYQQVALSVRMLGAVMNAPSEPAGGGIRTPLRGGLSFEGVSFQYNPNLPEVIRNFSLDIAPGETIGLVGPSGSGKSTLARLAQAMYPATQGLVKIDGTDIRELDKAHLRRSIGIVLQENYFFQATIRENIRLTRRDAPPELVVRAAQLAGAHDFIQTLPKGYDTVLEENAVNLSGGQKQRLAIARALLTDPAILILDEATSALDPESEAQVQAHLQLIARNRTVLIISHRLSMVRQAHRIVVLHDGQLADVGRHDELVRRPGLYRDFWNQQMGIGIVDATEARP